VEAALYGNEAAAAAGLSAGGDPLATCDGACTPPLVLAALWGHDGVARAFVEARCVGLRVGSAELPVVVRALAHSLQGGRRGLLECVARVAPGALAAYSSLHPLVGAVRSGDVGLVRAVLAVAPDVSCGWARRVCMCTVRPTDPSPRARAVGSRRG
jgi:hypothetical protein